MPTNDKLKTYNQDVVGMIRRQDRFGYELHKSVSSGSSQMNAFDQSRLQSYLDALKGYVAWVIDQPNLDLPESHPREYLVDEELVLPLVENEEVNDLLRMISVARAELISSQSSRDPAGLNKFDQSRYLALVGKMETFLKTYVVQVTPLDLPESSPGLAMSGIGKVGV